MQHTSARFLAVVLALLAACAATGPPPESAAERTFRPTDRVRAFDGADGSALTDSEVITRLRTADVVLFGELHGHPVGLPTVAEAFERAIEHEPAAALALEFLTRETQHLVDAYLADLIDYEDLLEATASIPGSSPTDHRPMVEVAKAAGLPVLAANSPRIYTRAASKRGYGVLSELSGSQQALFDVPTPMPTGAYEEGFYELMAGHRGGLGEGGPSDALRGSFRAQSLWDGTMAATVARARALHHRPVFLVVGQYHCDNDGGTLQVLRHMRPGDDILVVSVAATWSDELLAEDRDRADVILYVGPFEE